MIIGPVIVRKYINGLPTIPLELMQPTGQPNNDTSASITGNTIVNFGSGDDSGSGSGSGSGNSGVTASAALSSAAAATSDSNDPFSFPGRMVRW